MDEPRTKVMTMVARVWWHEDDGRYHQEYILIKGTTFAEWIEGAREIWDLLAEHGR